MEWSNSWKSSTKPRKQRKYRYTAPLHIRKKFTKSHLSKELREKYKKRSVTVIQGDKIKVLRGQYKGHTGKVENVDLKMTRIVVGGIEIQKKDGSKADYSMDPSNVIITELNLKDKKRAQMLERKK